MRPKYPIFAVSALFLTTLLCTATATSAQQKSHTRRAFSSAAGQYSNVKPGSYKPYTGPSSSSTSSSSSNSNLNPSNDFPNVASGYRVPVRDNRKPLEGGIQHNSSGGLVDTNDFQLDAQSNGLNPLRGNLDQAGSKPLHGKLDQDGARPLRGGLDQAPEMRVPLNAGAGTFDRRPLNGNIGDNKHPRYLNAKEIDSLKNYDVVVMQDRSSSMGEREYFPSVPFKVSRWDWCLDQAADLTKQTARVPNWGITLVMFSSKYDIYHNVSLRQIPQIYNRNGIFIGTRIADPLAMVFSQYFRRKASGDAKPLLVAIITDGKPQDDENLRDLLISTTQYMKDPREIQVRFLQVGTDDEGEHKLYKLDNRLMNKGAKYDIVSVMPFRELAQLGLARALVQTITR